jgi:hypothetical protein
MRTSDDLMPDSDFFRELAAFHELYAAELDDRAVGAERTGFSGDATWEARLRATAHRRHAQRLRELATSGT